VDGSVHTLGDLVTRALRPTSEFCFSELHGGVSRLALERDSYGGCIYVYVRTAVVLGSGTRGVVMVGGERVGVTGYTRVHNICVHG
jgi:hypothetical protein